MTPHPFTRELWRKGYVPWTEDGRRVHYLEHIQSVDHGSWLQGMVDCVMHYWHPTEGYNATPGLQLVLREGES